MRALFVMLIFFDLIAAGCSAPEVIFLPGKAEIKLVNGYYLDGKLVISPTVEFEGPFNFKGYRDIEPVQTVSARDVAALENAIKMALDASGRKGAVPKNYRSPVLKELDVDSHDDFGAKGTSCTLALNEINYVLKPMFYDARTRSFVSGQEQTFPRKTELKKISRAMMDILVP